MPGYKTTMRVIHKKPAKPPKPVIRVTILDRIKRMEDILRKHEDRIKELELHQNPSKIIT